MNIQIDTEALVRNIQSRISELENKRNLLHDRLAAVGSEIRSTEKEMMDIARTVCIKDYTPPTVQRGTLPVTMPPEPRARGASGQKRPPELIARHRAAMVASLRGGRSLRLSEIHSYVVNTIGQEDAGKMERTASMLNSRDGMFQCVDRGVYRLSDKTRAALDAQARE